VKVVNAHRAGMGVAPLAVSPTLTDAALFKSAHMSGGDYLSHDDPAPLARSVAERLSDCGYTQAAWAENIGKGYETAQAAVEGWLASREGHKENIEDAGHTHIGVGVVIAPDGARYWTQEFGVAQTASPLIQPRPAARVGGALATDRRLRTVHKSIPKRITKRSGLLKKRRAQSMRLKAVRGARSVSMSVKVRGKGWTNVKLRCAGKTVSRRARSRRPAKVNLKGVAASRCTITLRSLKRTMRYNFHAVTN